MRPANQPREPKTPAARLMAPAGPRIGHGMSEIPADFPDRYRITDPHDPFETGAGPFYSPVDDGGDPRVVLKAEPGHCNTSGAIHGGLLMTMADLALCAEANREMPEERSITISLNSEFVAAGQAGDFVVARAEVIRRPGSMVFVRGQIRAGDRVLLNSSAVVKRVKRG